MEKVIGIDLGTTNSVAAAIEGGQPTIILNQEGFRTTPSIIAYTKDKDLLVGQIAKRQSVINPDNTFFSVKRFIGSKKSDVINELKKVSYKIIADKKNNLKIQCSNLNQEFRPEEISALILKKLMHDASDFLGQNVKQAVITVPAYFNDSQRQATKDAGIIAGIDVLRIINEPTAASLAYGLDKKQNERILVFDLGGGTFDVSILEAGDGIFEVLATTGDTNLGGDDFDKVLVDWVIKVFNETESIDLSKDFRALQRITEAAERAKIELSTKEETIIDVPFITTKNNIPKHIKQSINRKVFEKLCNSLINRCQVPVEKALKNANLKKSDINEVVLVGGSTRIPAISNLVESLTDKKINRHVNPDEVVAIGAAVQAGILGGEIDDVLLLDITPLSLGIETLGGVMTKIIYKSTSIPVHKTELFSTAVDNQSNVEIHVLQGEFDTAKHSKSLGHFNLSGIPPSPKGEPIIEVTFDLNADGLLSVRAKEQKTNIQQQITIEGSSNLNPEELEMLQRELENA